MFATMDLTKNTQKCGAYSILLPYIKQPQLFKQCKSLMLMFLNAVTILIARFFFLFIYLFTLVNFNFVT